LLTRWLPCHTKIGETSNYDILAMKGPDVAFGITLPSRTVYHGTNQGLRFTCSTNQQDMFIGIIWEENAKVRM